MVSGPNGVACDLTRRIIHSFYNNYAGLCHCKSACAINRDYSRLVIQNAPLCNRRHGPANYYGAYRFTRRVNRSNISSGRNCRTKPCIGSAKRNAQPQRSYTHMHIGSARLFTNQLTNACRRNYGARKSHSFNAITGHFKRPSQYWVG